MVTFIAIVAILYCVFLHVSLANHTKTAEKNNELLAVLIDKQAEKGKQEIMEELEAEFAKELARTARLLTLRTEPVSKPDEYGVMGMDDHGSIAYNFAKSLNKHDRISGAHCVASNILYFRMEDDIRVYQMDFSTTESIFDNASAVVWRGDADEHVILQYLPNDELDADTLVERMDAFPLHESILPHKDSTAS